MAAVALSDIDFIIPIRNPRSVRDHLDKVVLDYSLREEEEEEDDEKVDEVDFLHCAREGS